MIDKIEMVSISSLKSHPDNRNKHPKEQIERLAKILEHQGFRYPVKVSKRSGFVTSGHGRIEAAKLKGWTEVPVSFQDYESEAQEYADVQADNAIASWAELDLSGITADIGILGPEFDLDMLGLKDFTIEIAGVEGQCDEDEVPEVKEPIAKLGDVWQLGEHRLMCGDSTSIDAVEKLMNGAKADMVFTSPPYNAGKKGFEAKGKYKNANDDDEALWLEMMSGFTSAWMTVSQYLFINLQILSGNKVKIHEWLHLFRNNFVDQMALTKSTLPAMEPNILNAELEFMYILNSDEHPKKHIKLGVEFRGNVSNVYEMRRSSGEFAKEHRATFDVSFPEYFINTFLGQGRTVADPFGGTGSTLIACEKTKRKCFMMELDPHYVDVIIARFEKYTGKKAVLTAP